ncbi:hypothetical protein [Mucilaginibacter ginsenosidivorans]|uniref:Uncharacterized protein n=1 Tax=Mucilaginibacter ginsenosidivorans TaxID=398053 RepID=A0A5B8UU78_9SPHI|nr:hypothetical protein [Mucilaginibacter ginsenosidivorans]QEC62667.1 hypothetical protein FRZ54_08730 [Mucilaginibacter ginsenosidivorans]
MARLRILTLISVLLAGITWYIRSMKPLTIPAGKGLVVNKAWLKSSARPMIPVKDVRPPDQTFLTFPEWFLVFSPSEQADYFKKHTSTTFPYQAHVRQLWKGYDVINDQIKGNYKFNMGYHVMIVVIAGSTTLEYDVKSVYETLAGRLTDIAPEEQMTDEDKFNAVYLNSYVEFIEQYPWYEYDFTTRLKQLWSGTDITGPHILRKAERRYYLTSELLVKAGYGWLIKLATKASYDNALFNTAVVTDKLPPDIKLFTEIKNIRKMPGGCFVMDLPRYAAFNSAACKLANSGVNFREIAGNKSAIMLTILTNKSLQKTSGWEVLFTQSIVTQPGLNRVAIVTPVDSLSGILRVLTRDRAIKVEHIYDY